MTVKLAEWRKHIGWTQVELAKALGITERQVRRLEHGDTPQSRMLELAMQALDAEHNRRASALRETRRKSCQ